jgi:hypothetical protein
MKKLYCSTYKKPYWINYQANGKKLGDFLFGTIVDYPGVFSKMDFTFKATCFLWRRFFAQKGIERRKKIGCWILDAGYWILDAGCWMLRFFA